MDRQALLKQLAQWHDEDCHQQIVDAILAISEDERDYDLTSLLARAYNNLGEYDRAIRLLGSIEKEGQNDPLWHYRMGFAYLYGGFLHKASEHLRKAKKLDPADSDADHLLEICRFRSNRDSEKRVHEEMATAEVYKPEEIEALEKFIQSSFGDFERVFHEIFSPDIHLDIAIIPPTAHRNFYTLVTMGMGAHRMRVPRDLKSKRLERAELMISLPPDWKIDSHEERWYWPIRLLKQLGRLPGNDNTWLGMGHTIDMGSPFAETRMCGAILCAPCISRKVVGPLDVPGSEEEVRCRMPDGSDICFYQVLPIYRDEMELKVGANADKLFSMFSGRLSPVVDVKRRNFAEIKDSFS
ncbi:MAG: tetratricopeptide repeat protein [Oscillospiraceae bacterium]|nr:tetratricopeptide repeat protein [Oscillospiraceae bacterium]